MAEYKVELTSGKSVLIEDIRSIEDLASSLCTHGFIHVQRLNNGGYQPETVTMIALMERAVMSIEPT